MTNARAIVWDGSFNDTSLPKINLNYVPALPKAIYDFAADGLPIGSLNAWPDSANGAEMIVRVGAPTVVEVGGKRAVKLNGDRLGLDFTVTGPRTIVAVYRFTTLNTYRNMVTWGWANDQGGAIGSSYMSTQMVGRVSTTESLSLSAIKPDTSWHIAILSVNGANSCFRVDNTEVAGSLTLNDLKGITLGYSPDEPPSYTVPIEFRRVSILGGTTTQPERNQLVNMLAARYGIVL
ncbi:hypothetical protein [Glutamicibacter protophormiae]|uniref:hypothetical protein n=1 Tax=Glutamicibacter protophormiae TaxID=37930 RepID=UPI003A94A3F9